MTSSRLPFWCVSLKGAPRAQRQGLSSAPFPFSFILLVVCWCCCGGIGFCCVKGSGCFVGDGHPRSCDGSAPVLQFGESTIKTYGPKDDSQQWEVARFRPVGIWLKRPSWEINLSDGIHRLLVGVVVPTPGQRFPGLIAWAIPAQPIHSIR